MASTNIMHNQCPSCAFFVLDCSHDRPFEIEHGVETVDTKAATPRLALCLLYADDFCLKGGGGGGGPLSQRAARETCLHQSLDASGCSLAKRSFLRSDRSLREMGQNLSSGRHLVVFNRRAGIHVEQTD